VIPKLKFLQESNEIEGIEFPEAAYLLEKTGNLHIDNSTRALKFVEENASKPLSSKLVLDLHQIQMHNILPEAEAGAWRNMNVMIGGDIPPSPAVLHYHMADWISKAMSLDPLKAHYWFEQIHPFSDGNGRTGRLLWAWMRLKRKEAIVPILTLFTGEFFHERRRAYYQEIRNGYGKVRR
jgi:Fic family protein